MINSKKVMVVGDALIDNQYYVAFLPKSGGDEQILQSHQSTGGSAANTAIMLAKQGVHSLFCGKIGTDDFGTIIKNKFTLSGVDISCLQYGEKTGYTLALVDQSGERTMLSYRGASGETLELGSTLIDTLKQVDILLISGYLLTANNQHAFVLKIIDIVKKHGGFVCFDPCPVVDRIDQSILSTVLSKTDILLPNKQELLTITASSDINAALKKLKVPVIAVKLGSEGALLRIAAGCAINEKTRFDADLLCRQAAEKADAVDTTGAGDAFNAGLIASIIKGDDPELWLEHANNSAYQTVISKGATD